MNTLIAIQNLSLLLITFAWLSIIYLDMQVNLSDQNTSEWLSLEFLASWPTGTMVYSRALFIQICIELWHFICTNMRESYHYSKVDYKPFVKRVWNEMPDALQGIICLGIRGTQRHQNSNMNKIVNCPLKTSIMKHCAYLLDACILTNHV